MKVLLIPKTEDKSSEVVDVLQGLKFPSLSLLYSLLKVMGLDENKCLTRSMSEFQSMLNSNYEQDEFDVAFIEIGV